MYWDSPFLKESPVDLLRITTSIAPRASGVRHDGVYFDSERRVGFKELVRHSLHCRPETMLVRPVAVGTSRNTAEADPVDLEPGAVSTVAEKTLLVSPFPWPKWNMACRSTWNAGCRRNRPLSWILVLFDLAAPIERPSAELCSVFDRRGPMDVWAGAVCPPLCRRPAVREIRRLPVYSIHYWHTLI